MWKWWFLTCIHNYVSIFWFIAKNVKNPLKSQMNFNGQPNMFFGNIISYTCNLHLKLNILNPLDIFFLLNNWKMNLLLQNFKTLKFLYDLVFHQIQPMNMYFFKKNMFLFKFFFEINHIILCIHFYYFFKKCNWDTRYN
jgi:hypothetical protein